MLRELVRKKLLEEHARIYVTERELLEKVLENFKYEIIDKDLNRKKKRTETTMLKFSGISQATASRGVTFDSDIKHVSRSSSSAVMGNRKLSGRLLRKTATVINLVLDDEDFESSVTPPLAVINQPPAEINFVPSKIDILHEDKSLAIKDDNKDDVKDDLQSHSKVLLCFYCMHM